VVGDLFQRKRAEDWDQRPADEPDHDVQGQPDAGDFAELVATRSVDHQIGLVTDRSRERQRRRHSGMRSGFAGCLNVLTERQAAGFLAGDFQGAMGGAEQR
jgi:hypothetical protein